MSVNGFGLGAGFVSVVKQLCFLAIKKKVNFQAKKENNIYIYIIKVL